MEKLMCLGLFPELQALGGIQRASRHMAAVIADLARRRDLDYKFLSLNDPHGSHHDEIDGLPYQYSGFQRSKSKFASSAFAVSGRKPRLIFVAHANLAPVAWLAKQRSQAPMAVVGWGTEVWEPLPWIRRKSVQSAEALVAISRFTAARFSESQGIDQRAIHLLPLALDPSFPVSESNGPTLPPPAWFPQGRVLLSVARLAASERNKGVDTVIHMLARIGTSIPDLQYLIVGDGDDRPRHERLARNLGIARQVHFAGALGASSPDLFACYANCDVFVLPSKQEGFGIVFLEAMAFGKPVIGGDHGGTPDVIQDGVTGFLIKYGDEEHLARIVEMLLQNESLRKTVGLEGQAHVKNHYQFENFRERLAGILEKWCSA